MGSAGIAHAVARTLLPASSMVRAEAVVIS